MKSFFALASLGALSVAQEYIDLCPSAQATAPASIAINKYNVGSKWQGAGSRLQGAGAKTWAPASSGEQCSQGFGSGEFAVGAQEKIALMREWNQLNKLSEMYKEQELLNEGVGSSCGYASTKPGYLIQPAAILERQNILPAATLYEPGYDASYAPGWAFDASCAGQAVEVYPEMDQSVIWCGERNLQGNNTLKRTNIHHNYVHDINHNHSYHNRTRHSAKQYNTVEKDCSCKGVPVAAPRGCPAEATAVAASLVGKAVGSSCNTGFGNTGFGTNSGYGRRAAAARIVGGLKTCNTCCDQ